MTPGVTDENDREDMLRLNAGQDTALNALMDRHAERLFNYILRQLNNPFDAADLAQETFVRVYQHRGRYNPAQKFATWLYAIATNLLRDRFRWQKRHPQVSLDASTDDGAALLDTLSEKAASPDQQLANAERASAVRAAVAALPEELRTPLILSEYEDLAHAEIGAILGCSAKAVETRLYRARGQLRKSLEQLVRSM